VVSWRLGMVPPYRQSNHSSDGYTRNELPVPSEFLVCIRTAAESFCPDRSLGM